MSTSPIIGHGRVIPTGPSAAAAPGQRDSDASRQPAGRAEQPATILTLSESARASLAAAPTVQDFAAVARQARATLDAHGADRGFADLDRRSLYAIASNEGQQFSEREQGLASARMGRQHAEAMGIRPDSAPAEIAAAFKRGIAFLEAVSPEEKASFAWAQQRAATQFGYESYTRRIGAEPENLDSDDPVVRLIKSAMDELHAASDPSMRLEDMPQYEQAEWAHAARRTKLVDRWA